MSKSKGTRVQSQLLPNDFLCSLVQGGWKSCSKKIIILAAPPSERKVKRNANNFFLKSPRPILSDPDPDTFDETKDIADNSSNFRLANRSSLSSRDEIESISFRNSTKRPLPVAGLKMN